MRTHHSLFLACIVLILSVQNTFASTLEEAIAQIKDRHKDSVSSLKTWKGTAMVSFASDRSDRTSKPPGKIALEKWISHRQNEIDASLHSETLECQRAIALGEVDISEGEVEFAFDAATQSRRWNWMSKCIVTDGVDLTNSHARFNGMFKDDAFLRLGPFEQTVKGKVMGTVHKKDGPHFLGHFSMDFDPTFFFTIEAQPYDYLDSFISTKEYKRDVEHSESDGEITITSKYPGSTQLMAFTPAGLLSKYEFRSDKVTAETTIEWESINQAWVPSSYRFRRVESDKEENPTTVRVVVFNKHSVNTPISPSEFSLHALGLREGDLIQDTRTGSTKAVTEVD